MTNRREVWSLGSLSSALSARKESKGPTQCGSHSSFLTHISHFSAKFPGSGKQRWDRGVGGGQESRVLILRTHEALNQCAR